MPHPDPASWLRRNLALATLPVAILLLWWPSLHANFQFDDWNVVVHDPRVASPGAWLASMPGIRPLLKLSYALNAQWGVGVAGYRVVNIGIHALNTLWIAVLMARKARDFGESDADARRAAWLAAAIFAFHPAQTEAVTYISGRSGALAACFALPSLYAWSRSEKAASPGRSALWLGLCCLLMLLAAASKETAIVEPLIFALWSAARSHRRPTPRARERGAFPRLLVPLVLAASLLLLAALWPPYRQLLAFSLQLRRPAANLLTQVHAWTYLTLQMVRIGNMNADPGLPVITAPDPFSMLLLVLWTTLIVMALRRLRNGSAAAFALLWFLGWLLPTHSLLPRLDVANDRQLYLPLAGPALWLSLQFVRAAPRHARFVGATALLLIVSLMVATADRNRDYATEIRFWERTSLQNPSNARAANNLGMAYALACRPAEAAQQFRRALALDPADARARLNLHWLRRGELPGVVCINL
jgi:tetratricopeptide (TPR) repeat protein